MRAMMILAAALCFNVAQAANLSDHEELSEIISLMSDNADNIDSGFDMYEGLPDQEEACRGQKTEIDASVVIQKFEENAENLFITEEQDQELYQEALAQFKSLVGTSKYIYCYDSSTARYWQTVVETFESPNFTFTVKRMYED